MTRDELIEKMAQALIDADPSIDGYHETHVEAKRPYACAALSAIEEAGFWIAPVSASEKMTYAAFKTLEPVFDDERSEPNQRDWQDAYAAMRKASHLYEEKGE